MNRLSFLFFTLLSFAFSLSAEIYNLKYTTYDNEKRTLFLIFQSDGLLKNPESPESILCKIKADNAIIDQEGEIRASPLIAKRIHSLEIIILHDGKVKTGDMLGFFEIVGTPSSPVLRFCGWVDHLTPFERVEFNLYFTHNTMSFSNIYGTAVIVDTSL